MFQIPEQYYLDKSIAPSVFISRSLKKAEKNRVKDNLLSVALRWQISGEDIPSRLDDDYHCAVIMGLECRLKDIKNAAFLAGLVQPLMKAPCVVRFFDSENEVYSFAHKRLNHNAPEEIVVLDRVQTPALPLAFSDKVDENLRHYLDFQRLRNKRDKLSLYLEALVKAFIVSRLNLFSGLGDLLEGTIWYNLSIFMGVFERVKELDRLYLELEATRLPGEKAKIISRIKSVQSALSEQ